MRGFGSSGKQASCLENEGPRTSPKTGADTSAVRTPPAVSSLVAFSDACRRASPHTSHWQASENPSRFRTFPLWPWSGEVRLIADPRTGVQYLLSHVF